MAVSRVTNQSFKNEVLESDVPVVVDFYADWCGPCHQIAPALEDLSEKWDGEVRFVKCDIEANRKVAGAYRISSIPAVLLFHEGRPVAWSLGAKPGYVIEKELGLTKLEKKFLKEEKRRQKESGERPGVLGALKGLWKGT